MERTQTAEVDPEVVAVLNAGRKRGSRVWLVGGALVLLGGAGAVALRGRAVPRYETAEVTRGALVETVTPVCQCG